MPTIKLLNLFALSTFAILLCSLAPSQTLAVSIRAEHLARQIPNHHGVAKKKRATKRCKPRSSSLPPSSTPVPKPTNTPKNDISEPTSTPKDDTPKTTSTPKNDPSTSSSSPPANPTNTPTGSGKLAIAWAMGNDERIKYLKSSRVKMFHLWGAEIPSAVKDTGIPASIMLWSDSSDRVSRFLQFAKAGYASHVFGFNEVNEPSQANMDVGSAVSAWYKYIKPLASQGYTLGSPSTTSAPNGFTWVTDFLNQCGGDCGVDEIAIHWYDVKFEDLKTYVNKWAGFGKPLRVTEFACQNFNGGAQPSADDIWSFTDQAIDFFEGDGRVLSYAPFGFMDNMYNVNANDRLFTSNGLSDLGWKYINGN